MVNNILLYEDVGKIPNFFSDADIQKIFDAIDDSEDYLKSDWGEFMRARDRALCATIFLLALRPNEACSLRFDDFNLDNMTLHIRGENNKQKKDRVLPIPASLLAYYKALNAFSRERFWKGSAFLFPSFENEHISAGRWKMIFREKILKAAGLWIKPDMPQHSQTRSYTLRHTRLSQVYNKTHDIFMVANIAGHARLSSSKVYVHTDKNYLEDVRQTLSC